MKAGASQDLNLSTVDAEVRPVAPNFPFLELWIQGRDGLRYLPFLENPQTFRVLVEGEHFDDWSVELNTEQRLYLSQPGKPNSRIEVLQGEELLLGLEKLVVIDRRTLLPYRLVSLSSHPGSRHWELGDGDWTIGRPGKRNNTISLPETSVSRAHARLEISGKSARIFSETDGALTAINEHRLAGGQSQALEPNDVIQIGELLFRWERQERALWASGSAIHLQGLGAQEVSLGTAKEDVIDFRNENAKSLLFWLACHRESSVSVERILEQYWPEKPLLRQRKNLSHCLKALQSELGWSENEFTDRISRHPDYLRFEPADHDSCDIWKLQDGLQKARAEGATLFELLELHPGPLLPGWDQIWVRSLRRDLFWEWLGAVAACQPDTDLKPVLASTLARCLRIGDFEEYVYERAFALASAFGLQEMILPCLSELSDRLQETTGDEPSQQLRDLAHRLTIGKGSDSP